MTRLYCKYGNFKFVISAVDIPPLGGKPRFQVIHVCTSCLRVYTFDVICFMLDERVKESREIRSGN